MITTNCIHCGGPICVRGEGTHQHHDMRDCISTLHSLVKELGESLSTLRVENEQQHKRLRRDAAYWVETGV